MRLLQLLRAVPQVETHLVLSQAGGLTVAQELDMTRTDLEALADVVHSPRDIGASVASGSFVTEGMVVAPCSMKTLASIALGLADNLVSRAADVVLKEQRRLVLLARETPLNQAHLRNMLAVTEMGGVICPPVPAFYQRPQSLDEVVEHTCVRVLDLFGLGESAAAASPRRAPLVGARPVGVGMTLATSDHIRQETRMKIIALAAAAASTVLASLPAAAKLNSCDGPIVFGTTLSETGPFSTLADRWRKMTEVFAEEINKSGGIAVKACNKKLPLQFVIYDDQSVPATAVQLYEKMATVDKVDFFVGPDWSSIGGPVPPIADKYQIPMVMANVATPALYDRGLKYTWGTPFPVVPNWSARYFDMLTKVSPKPQSIYFITHDNPVMKGITATWSKKAEAQGLKVLATRPSAPS